MSTGRQEGYEPRRQSHQTMKPHETHLSVEDILVERDMVRIIK